MAQASRSRMAPKERNASALPRPSKGLSASDHGATRHSNAAPAQIATVYSSTAGRSKTSMVWDCAMVGVSRHGSMPLEVISTG
ncbi:hypothetical protein D3C72_2219400 [compost metagenome]